MLEKKEARAHQSSGGEMTENQKLVNLVSFSGHQAPPLDANASEELSA